MKAIRKVALTAGALAAVSLPASAQQIEVTPFAGGGFFLTDLAPAVTLDNGDACW